MWESATTDAFDEWFTALGDSPEGRDARVELIAAVRTLRTFGPTLGRPFVDTLKGSKHANLKELRVRTSAMVLRVAFAFDPLQKAILLVGGDKGGVSEKRFYRSLIASADTLYDSHLAAIAPMVAARKAAAQQSQRKGRK